MSVYRIIDANINRVSEGLRVLEDIYRFIFNSEEISKELRILRHKVRKNFQTSKLLEGRDSIGDVGLRNSRSSKLDDKKTLLEVKISNFKRVEEGLRSIEESLKLLGAYEQAKDYELIRYKVYQLEKESILGNSPLDTDLYVILDQDLSKSGDNIKLVKDLVKAGVKTIQYRDKEKSKYEKYKECKEIKSYLEDKDVFFIINDDLDIALAVGADGLHIGQDDLDLEIAKAAAPELIIGVSTHNEEEAILAQKQGADYIGVGPIFHTDTKKDLSFSKGLEYLSWVSKNISIPYVAIGGIKEENILEVKRAGASCFAMISEIVSASDIELKVKNIRKKLEDD